MVDLHVRFVAALVYLHCQQFGSINDLSKYKN